MPSACVTCPLGSESLGRIRRNISPARRPADRRVSHVRAHFTEPAGRQGSGSVRVVFMLNFFVLAMQPVAQHLAGHGASMDSWGWRQP